MSNLPKGFTLYREIDSFSGKPCIQFFIPAHSTPEEVEAALTAVKQEEPKVTHSVRSAKEVIFICAALKGISLPRAGFSSTIVIP